MSDDEQTNVCYKCGKVDLLLGEVDKKDSRDRNNCPECKEPGPYCEQCILHHLKHCRGVEEEISDNEDCSECSEDGGEDGEYEEDFVE